MGATDESVARTQMSWAASISHSLAERWNGAIEFSGTRQRGTSSASQALFALAFSVSKRVVIDAGTARGLNGSKPGTYFAGISILMGSTR